MRKLIAIIALTVASTAAAADGFAPWNERHTPLNQATSTQSADASVTGFAPWRNRDVQAHEIHGTADVVTIDDRGFRPWS